MPLQMPATQFIIRMYPVLLLLLLVVCAILGLAITYQYRRAIIKSVNVGMIIILAISALAFLLRTYIVPHRHYVVYDEYVNINYAQNIHYANKFAYCIQGTESRCEKIRAAVQGGGYPVLLSQWINVFGDSEKSAFLFSVICGTLAVAFIGFLGYLLFDSASAGAWCSFLLCITPAHLKYSGTTTLCIASFLFVIILFCAAGMLIRVGGRLCLFFTATVLLYLIHIRIENIVFLILLPLFFILYRRREANRLSLKAHDFGLLLMFGLIYTCALYSIIYTGKHVVFNDGWNDSLGEQLSFFKAHIVPNLAYIFFSNKVPSVLLVLSVIGMVIHARERGLRNIIFWGIYFSAFLAGYSFYHIGNFNSVESDRFTLNFYVPIILWAGYCLAQIRPKKWTLGRIGLSISTILILIYWCLGGYIKTTMHEKLTYDEQIRRTFKVIESMPESTAVLSYNTSPYIPVLHRYSVDLRYLDMSPPPKEAIYIRSWITPDKALTMPLVESVLAQHYYFKRLVYSSRKDAIEVYRLNRKY